MRRRRNSVESRLADSITSIPVADIVDCQYAVVALVIIAGVLDGYASALLAAVVLQLLEKVGDLVARDAAGALQEDAYAVRASARVLEASDVHAVCVPVVLAGRRRLELTDNVPKSGRPRAAAVPAPLA